MDYRLVPATNTPAVRAVPAGPCLRFLPTSRWWHSGAFVDVSFSRPLSVAAHPHAAVASYLGTLHRTVNWRYFPCLATTPKASSFSSRGTGHVPFPHPSRYLGMSKGRYPSIHPPAHPIPSHPILLVSPSQFVCGSPRTIVELSLHSDVPCETLRLTSRAQSKRRGTTAPDRPGLRQRATTRFCSPLRVPALLRGRVALAEPDVSLVAEPGRGR